MTNKMKYISCLLHFIMVDWFFIFKSYVRSWHKSTHVQRYFFLEAYVNFLFFGYFVKVIWFFCRQILFFLIIWLWAYVMKVQNVIPESWALCLPFQSTWDHLPVFSGVRVTRSLVLCVCFVDRCLFFCTFSFGHCVVCSSTKYGFWLPPFCIFKLFLICMFLLQDYLCIQ
jgi:hypothetical protein